MRAKWRVHTWLAAVAGSLFVAGNVAHAQTEATDATIYFEFDSDALDAGAQSQLDEVADWAKEHEERRVVIAGHTDKIGTEAYNMELGGRRAISARKYLVNKGIAENRITVLSFGESVPASERNAENRRVVFLDQREPEAAQAEPVPQPEPYVPPPQPLPEEPPPASQPDYLTPAGMSFVIGGGVMNFTDGDTRDVTNVGGTWEARFAYGTQSVIGVEAAYTGTAQNVDALGLDTSAALLGSSGTAALRLNVPGIEYVTPYAIAGIGFTRFDIINEDFNDSSLDDTETAVTIPVGAGVGFTYEGFLFDLRGMYRPSLQDDLLNIPEDAIDNEHNGPLDLDTWSATAAVGVEF